MPRTLPFVLMMTIAAVGASVPRANPARAADLPAVLVYETHRVLLDATREGSLGARLDLRLWRALAGENKSPLQELQRVQALKLRSAGRFAARRSVLPMRTILP